LVNRPHGVERWRGPSSRGLRRLTKLRKSAKPIPLERLERFLKLEGIASGTAPERPLTVVDRAALEALRTTIDRKRLSQASTREKKRP
jgi:hypothetical protein